MLAARYITDFLVTLQYKINRTVTVLDIDKGFDFSGKGCHTVFVIVQWYRTLSLIPTKDGPFVTQYIYKQFNLNSYIATADIYKI